MNNNCMVKIKTYVGGFDKSDKNSCSSSVYEGRFLGFVDNVMLRLLLNKAEAVRKIYSKETISLENFINNGKTIKGNRLVFALKNKNDIAIYGNNNLFITEIIESVTHLNHVHTSISTLKKDNGVETHGTLIEKVKITCLGKNETRFVLTEFYKF